MQRVMVLACRGSVILLAKAPLTEIHLMDFKLSLFVNRTDNAEVPT
jgi:hypothetical protein